MQQPAKVATVIVTYNGAKWIEKCLTFLLNSTYKSTIILVDNKSTDNTIALIQPFIRNIVFIQSETNAGFGASNNVGIKKAIELNADYVFLLNQDAYVKADCIEILLKTIRQYPEYGILSPMQLNSTGQGLDLSFQIQIARTVKKNPKTSFNDHYTNNEISKPLMVKFIAAAAWFMPVKVIKQVGLFHPVFYHYGEDNNYAARVHYFNYKIGVAANTAVIHDRFDKATNDKLVTKLSTLPLYTILDIRKPFYIAYLLGLNKLYRYRNKLKRIDNNKSTQIFNEQRKWFFEKLKEIKKLRKETKAGLASAWQKV